MAPTTVLITGANRGLGKGLARRYLAMPNYVVIAAVRDPSHFTAQELSSFPKGEGTKLVVLKYDAAIEQAAYETVETLKSEHGIDKLDVVIANAAIAKGVPLVKDAKRADLVEHFNVNVLGVLSLFQATRDLLKKAASFSGGGSEKKPVFAILGSVAGTMTDQPLLSNAVYGPSKAYIHWCGVRIHHEEEWLSTLIIHPGWVQTDMGNMGAISFGMEEAPLTVEDSVDGVFAVITDADSRAKYGGKLVSWEGQIVPW